jgi:hypothetical protein
VSTTDWPAWHAAQAERRAEGVHVFRHDLWNDLAPPLTPEEIGYFVGDGSAAHPFAAVPTIAAAEARREFMLYHRAPGTMRPKMTAQERLDRDRDRKRRQREADRAELAASGAA